MNTDEDQAFLSLDNFEDFFSEFSLNVQIYSDFSEIFDTVHFKDSALNSPYRKTPGKVLRLGIFNGWVFFIKNHLLLSLNFVSELYLLEKPVKFCFNLIAYFFSSKPKKLQNGRL